MNEATTICPVGAQNTHRATGPGGHPTGHRLCGDHFERLGKLLREIESETLNLDPVPSIAVQWNTAGGNTHSGALAFEKAPIRLEPVALTDPRLHTDSVLAILAGLADRIRAERNLLRPTITYAGCVHPATGVPMHIREDACDGGCPGVARECTATVPATVGSERDLLTRNLEWVAGWADIGAVFAKLRRLLGRLRAANDTGVQSLGKCPGKTDAGFCGGDLWPAKPKYTVGEWTGATPSAVKCDRCDARWEGGDQLAILALMLEGQRRGKAS